ncbi:hypothetical protein V2W30_23530 [Streptomyces sp. Q6]|uniref:Uncharacterized protein n=1 Tax=Streptomyces citrinus TaxID=3118173 RepID=A0ACD5AFX8_9ACTN
MGFLERLTGTRRPAEGVAPRSAQEVRELLLSLGGGDVPWVVRGAAPEEEVEFVAEWRVREPAWWGFFRGRRVDRTVRIRTRLVPEDREVRALQEQWEVSWVDGTPRFARSRAYGRGQGRTVGGQWTFGRDEGGGRRLEETFRFDTAELTDPVRDAVLGAGWTWRAVTFGKL